MMKPGKSKTLRCAVYTRKSSEEGLEQDFNSLRAQREACESFIRSQQGEGWTLIKTHYDDGGFSGGTMQRPALQRLLDDIRHKLVDTVVVYKVDRLTRSLSDFAKMVEVFDAHGASFVAVTQQFNTTTSMGRLTLNVLLSFAQFEREVTGERIRDKIAASKRKGMWMGGLAPLGYEVRDGKLVIEPSEAKTVRRIFKHYCELGSVRLLKDQLDKSGTRSKVRIAKNGKRSGGESFSRGALYTLLRNPIYIGEVKHKATRYPGLHRPIIERAVWDKADELLRTHASRDRGTASKSMRSPLAGRIFDESGKLLTPSHAVKGKHRYRYYVSRNLLVSTAENVERGWRIPAAEIERSVTAAVIAILGDRIGIANDIKSPDYNATRMKSVFEAATDWTNRLRSETQAPRALALLVERVDLREDGILVSIKLPVEPAGSRMDDAATHLSLARMIPMQMSRRGVEVKLVIGGDHEPSGKSDPALLKLIARAHCWFDELVTGRAASMVEIGRREIIGKRHVSEIIRLAFLAPEIVEQIASGAQPPELTAKTLLQGSSRLPLDWETQRKYVEIPLTSFVSAALRRVDDRRCKATASDRGGQPKLLLRYSTNQLPSPDTLY
jgi:site-specific DNA recombinase